MAGGEEGGVRLEELERDVMLRGGSGDERGGNGDRLIDWRERRHGAIWRIESI